MDKPRANEIERRERTNEQQLEYSRSHFEESSRAMRLVAAVASFARSPSTEKTSGVKWRRRSRQGWRYFFFFAVSWYWSVVDGG